MSGITKIDISAVVLTDNLCEFTLWWREFICALCKTINNYLTHQPTNLLIKDAFSHVYYIFVIKQIDVLQIFKLTKSISSILSIHLLPKIDPPIKKIEFLDLKIKKKYSFPVISILFQIAILLFSTVCFISKTKKYSNFNR